MRADLDTLCTVVYCTACWVPKLRRSPVLVQQPAQQVAPLESGEGHVWPHVRRWYFGRVWRSQTKSTVRAVSIVMGHVDRKHTEKMTLTKDQQMVQTLAASTTDETFHDGVRFRRLVRRAHRPNVRASQQLIEGAGELGIAIVDEEAHMLVPIVEIHEQVTRLLADPGAGGVGRNRDVLNAARGKRDEDQHVVAPKADSLHSEEVDGQNAFRLGPQEGTPARLAAPWGRRQAGTQKQPADRAGGAHYSQALHFAHDAPIAPARVLARQSQDELAQFCR